jgi:hypothetical protein
VPNNAHTVRLYTTQVTSGAQPGRPAAIALSTTPLISETPNAYVWSQPRIRGLPTSTGRSLVALVTKPGYGTVS